MEISNLKDALIIKNKTLGSVESFTGGLFASSITKIAGASKFFKGALVTYATEEKESLLGIDHDLISKHGVVSKEIGIEMATKGRKILNVDYCVSFTGNAGPDAMEGKPVGLVYICVADLQNVVCEERILEGSRENIQKEAILIALEILDKKIK